MPFDSTADLLFRIGADSGDAESNIERFRTLLGKDLDDLSGEFSDWAEKVFGNLTTVSGAMTAATATLAAAVVGIAGAAVEAAGKYEEYVSQVADGSRKTGIAAEQMSALKFAAAQTGTSYDGLVRGLTFFETAVVKANAGGSAQQEMFARLGITQAQVAAGERNIVPLLELVMDRFHGMASGTERAAMARELFSRGGAEMLGFLSMGSAGLAKMTEEAEKLGLVITSKDVEAMREHQAAVRLLKEELEALAVTVGREVLPYLTVLVAALTAIPEAAKRTAEDLKHFGPMMEDAFTGGLSSYGRFLGHLSDATDEGMRKIQDLVHSMQVAGTDGLAPVTEKAAEAKQEFYGLSTVLESVKSKLASQGSDEDRLVQEISHLQQEIARAGAEYQKLAAAGKLAGDAARREALAMIELPGLMARLAEAATAEIARKRKEAADKTAADYDAAGEDLRQKINAQREHTFAEQMAAWDIEIAKLREHLAKKGELAGVNEQLVADLQQAGENRISREQTSAFEQELIQLQSHLAQMVQAHMTSQERLEFQYDQDLAKYSEVEMEKSIKAHGGEMARAQIEQQYAINRKALTDNYKNDLQALQNSSGWQGVFGSKFGALLKGNEAAMREWATSGNQSMLLLKDTLIMLDQVGQQTFEHFAQGMGGNIASAVVYSKSVKEAMQSALASTLESLAAEAMTYAIYATALGFLRLAQYDPAGASAAFTSAAIWGTVGVGAALAGRAVAPSQSAAGGAGSGVASGHEAGTSPGGPGSGNAGGAQGPHVTVNVWGHVFGVSGIQELASAMNDAVLNRDVTFTATNTKTGVVVTK